jgi:hypothetical protein
MSRRIESQLTYRSLIDLDHASYSPKTAAAIS